MLIISCYSIRNEEVLRAIWQTTAYEMLQRYSPHNYIYDSDNALRITQHLTDIP